jgi:WD40 repeat protein
MHRLPNPIEIPPIKSTRNNPQYIPHPRFDLAPCFSKSDAFYRYEEQELQYRDTVGVHLPNLSPPDDLQEDDESFLILQPQIEEAHVTLPTSVTYKIKNETTTITSLDISNHGVYLGIGTQSGLIRLYCFGRNHRNNIILQQMQLNYESDLNNDGDKIKQIQAKLGGSNPSSTSSSSSTNSNTKPLPFGSELTHQKDSNPSWQHLIGKGVFINSIGEQNDLTTSSLLHTVVDMDENVSNFTSISPKLPPPDSNKPLDPKTALDYQVHELYHHQTAVTSLKFSPCLNFMLSVDMNGTICLWSLTLEFTNAYSHANDLVLIKKSHQKLNPPHSKSLNINTGTHQINDLNVGQTPLSLNTDENNPKTRTPQDTTSSTTIPIDQTLTTPPNSPQRVRLQVEPIEKPIQLSNTIDIRLNDPLNKPILLFSWDSFPSPSNSLILNPRIGNGYFAISHIGVGVSIFRTDHPQPIRLIPPIPKNISYYANPMLTPSNQLAWSPNGGYLAVAYEQGRIGIYSPFSELNLTLPQKSLECSQGRVTAMAFSPDGRYLFTADSTLTMILWDIDAEEPIWMLDPLYIRTESDYDLKYNNNTRNGKNNVLKSQYGAEIELSIPIQRLPHLSQANILIEGFEDEIIYPHYKKPKRFKNRDNHNINGNNDDDSDWETDDDDDDDDEDEDGHDYENGDGSLGDNEQPSETSLMKGVSTNDDTTAAGTGGTSINKDLFGENNPTMADGGEDGAVNTGEQKQDTTGNSGTIHTIDGKSDKDVGGDNTDKTGSNTGLYGSQNTPLSTNTADDGLTSTNTTTTLMAAAPFTDGVGALDGDGDQPAAAAAATITTHENERTERGAERTERTDRGDRGDNAFSMEDEEEGDGQESYDILNQQTEIIIRNELFRPPPQTKMVKGTWPMYLQNNKGTIHTDIITSCSFSYHTPQSYTTLYSSPDGQPDKSLSHLNPFYFPYILATTSLDGTTKLWYPMRGTPGHNDGGVVCGDLGRCLLQTVYSTPKHITNTAATQTTKTLNNNLIGGLINPVQLCSFTSRNLLLLVTTDDSAD